MKPVRNKDTWASPLAGVLSTTLGAYYDQFPLKRPRPDVPTTTALERAIVAGTVTYSPGLFRGTFNASISSELKAMGGTYRSDIRAWAVPPHRVPASIQMLARRTQDTSAAWKTQLSSAVEKAAPVAVVAAMALPAIYRALSLQVAKSITDTTGREVVPQTAYDEGSVFKMTVEEAIKGFSEKETKRIAALIKKSTAEEWPAAWLEEALVGRVGVSMDRAKVMAKQGTAIAATELKSKYYIQAGLPKYRWKTQGDDRVRSDHAVLDGQVFDWNNPPLVNTSTGLHAHPGQDYRCRCDAIPLEDYE